MRTIPLFALLLILADTALAQEGACASDPTYRWNVLLLGLVIGASSGAMLGGVLATFCRRRLVKWRMFYGGLGLGTLIFGGCGHVLASAGLAASMAGYCGS